jgi:hypothetical protein
MAQRAGQHEQSGGTEKDGGELHEMASDPCPAVGVASEDRLMVGPLLRWEERQRRHRVQHRPSDHEYSAEGELACEP